MGNFMPSLPFVGGKGLKRKSSEDDLLDDDEYAASGKRRKLATTSSYIFKALYQEGQNSDITINALGFQWNLHRVYLCQSAYFASMFGGAWANAEEVEIEINNPNITKEALDIVFGSFYQDEIEIDPDIAIKVLSTATLFQLNSVVSEAKYIVCDSICSGNITDLHRFSFANGYDDVCQVCFEWLEVNLLQCIYDDPCALRNISMELLIMLLGSKDLYVQSEIATYLIIKAWTFLRLHPKWVGCKANCTESAYLFFKDRLGKIPFLETEEGATFIPLFKLLHLNHLNTEVLERDALIPQRWLISDEIRWSYEKLRLELGVDKGVKSIERIFYGNCSRFGKIVTDNSFQSWQWTGSFIDLTVSFERVGLRFRNNYRLSPQCQSTLDESADKKILCRITITTTNDKFQKLAYYDTGIGDLNLNIDINQEIEVLTLPDTAKFPIVISACFLLYSPAKTPAEAKIATDLTENCLYC